MLDETDTFVECTFVSSMEQVDHSLFVGEVLEAGIENEPEGGADDAALL